MNKTILIPLAAAACLMAGSCAKKTVSTTGQYAKEYIQLWVEKNYPGVTPDQNGLYILNDQPGAGEVWSSENEYALLSSTIRTLDGTISSTTSEELARQLGTYSKSTYYGPKYQYIASGYSYAGVDAMLQGMRVGGTRQAIIPAWMLTASRYKTQQEYIDNCSGSTHFIYEITLEGQTEDPNADETAILRRYIVANYGNIASAKYDEEAELDGTFYFISDVSGFKEEDALSSNATVKINYTGKRLDGTVFDTSLEKVARKAGIHSDARTYEPQSVTFSEKYADITMGGSSSLVSGFKGGLSLMKWKGQKATVVFTSKHGYAASGKGGAIPGYTPLIFELEILND